MELSQLQEEVDRGVKAQTPKGASPYWPPFVILARLTEEVGELSRELNHLFGPKQKRGEEVEDNLAGEIGDILFTLTCMANSLHVKLDGAVKLALAKCEGRDKERFKKEGQ